VNTRGGFLAEFTRIRREKEYVLYFPSGGHQPEFVKRYTCKYVRVGSDEIMIAGTNHWLSSAVLQKVDDEVRKSAKWEIG
jgi:hypothetical protein